MPGSPERRAQYCQASQPPGPPAGAESATLGPSRESWGPRFRLGMGRYDRTRCDQGVGPAIPTPQGRGSFARPWWYQRLAGSCVDCRRPRRRVGHNPFTPHFYRMIRCCVALGLQPPQGRYVPDGLAVCACYMSSRGRFVWPPLSCRRSSSIGVISRERTRLRRRSSALSRTLHHSTSRPSHPASPLACVTRYVPEGSGVVTLFQGGTASVPFIPVRCHSALRTRPAFVRSRTN